MDAQGAEKARPFHEKSGATFKTVVDEENLLGQMYGFRAIPNGFLIDGEGVVRFKQLGGFDIREAETAALVERWAKGGSVEPGSDEDDAPGDAHSMANALFREGMSLYREGQVDGAMGKWREGVALEPDNYIIRKQIWAVENPNRFYSDEIDWDWQAKQMKQGR